MAKCDLSIELDDPKSVHPGGGKITGVVRVVVDKNVSTKGLVITSGWATHGRGNVASGETASETLFTGDWRAGDKLEYRFELPIGNWPPSYHGNYLNIDHYINVRAKIPWGFDPKASQAFLMRPTGGAETAVITKNVHELSGKIGCIVFSIISAIFATIFVTVLGAVGFSPFMLFFAIIPLIGFVVFFVKVLLPKYLLGDVQCHLEPEQVSPGDDVRGELVITPRKNVNINAIKMTFKASEKVISGSGSNRTTHTNVFFEKETTLQGEGVLQAGQTHRIDLNVQLPDDAPYSIDLDDNDLIWSTFLRIDIPRWPDWTKDLPIKVVPSGKPPEPTSTTPAASQASSAAVVAPPSDASSDQSNITFAETAQHFWGLKDDHDAVSELADAISGLSFDLEAFVERRLLYSGEEDPHVYKDGYAIWAHYTDPPLKMVLYVPHDLADDFEQLGRDLWRGRGTVVGWDNQHRRLQIKLESQIS